MGKIWKYIPDADHYYTLALKDYKRDGWIIHETIKTEPFPEPFPTIQVCYETNPKDLSPSQRRLLRQGKLPKGDFPSFYAVGIVFSERAVRVLWPLIQSSVQIIPLEGEEDRLFLVHVLDVIDCLDLERSVCIGSGGIITHVRHYEFKNLETLKGKGIFRIRGLRASAFVTDTFKALVEEHDLKGLLWQLLP